MQNGRRTWPNVLLQIQGKWYRERKPKKNPKPEGNKKSKNYSTPEFLPGSKEKLRPHVIGAGILYGNGTALRKLWKLWKLWKPWYGLFPWASKGRRHSTSSSKQWTSQGLRAWHTGWVVTCCNCCSSKLMTLEETTVECCHIMIFVPFLWEVSKNWHLGCLPSAACYRNANRTGRSA